MDEQTQKRSERVRAAFGIHPRMRTLHAISGQWVTIFSASSYGTFEFNDPSTGVWHSGWPAPSFLPDPDDAMNLGLLRGIVQVDFDNPTLYARPINVPKGRVWRIDGDEMRNANLAGHGPLLVGDQGAHLIGDTESDAWCAAKELADG